MLMLNRKLSNSKRRNIRFCNLNNAKNIGIIYNLDDERDSHKLLRFIKYLKEEFGVRKISAITYFEGKEMPSFLIANSSLQCFVTKDLTWRNEPVKDVCLDFIEQDFDLLIDVSNQFVIPLKSILVDSKAKFKVGKYSEENEAYYDFMIDSKHIDFHDFTKELVEYLTIINEK